MAIYTVHVPDDVSDLVTQADRTLFVREGFSARAFLFGLVYLVWHRLWLAGVIWALLLVGLAGVWLVLHPPLFLLVALIGLMHLYLGTEGAQLARWSLARRGCPVRDLVSASTLGDAEAAYFMRQPFQPALAPRAVPRTSVPLPLAPTVIGFPDEGTP